MTGSSGIGNNLSRVNQDLTQMNIAETQSDTAMEETKSADKAARLEAAALELNLPQAMSADGEIEVKTFVGPEIKADRQPDAEKAEAFLHSETFNEGQETVKERNFIVSKLFSDQSMLLIEMQRAFSKARDGQSAVSSELSQLGGEVTAGLAENIRQKGFDNFGMQVAGHVMQMGMAGGSMYSGAKSFNKSRTETKAFHQNINTNIRAQQDQTKALRQMELDGKAGTPEHIAAKDRLETTVQEGKQMGESHELSDKKYQQQMLIQQGITQLSGAAGGSIGAGAAVTEATNQADIVRRETTRDQASELRNRSNQAIKELEDKINDAIRAFRDIEAASVDVIGGVAKNI